MLFTCLFLQTFICFISKSFIYRLHKSLTFSSLCFFFFNTILVTVSYSRFPFLFCGLHFFFFSLELRRRTRWWQWARSYHFASFDNVLFYWHFTNEMYIFLLIFVASISNIKSQLASYAVIVHPTETFWR